MTKYSKGDYTNCRCNICEIVDEDDKIVCNVVTEDFEKVIGILEENEKLKQAYDDAKSDVEKYEQILKDIFNDNLLIQDAKKELSE